MSASDEGERPPLPNDRIITLSSAEARRLRDVYLSDWDAPDFVVERARQILERLAAEADEHVDAIMRWEDERRRARYEEHRRQLKTQDS